MPKRPHPLLVMAIAVVAMSWAAPLIRLSTAPPLAIAAWRLTFATLLLSPVLAASRNQRLEWAKLGGPQRHIAALAGVFLALHFASWITSLRLTTVAASAVLVSLSPVFAWVFSRAFLGERPARRQAVGIVLAIIGAAVIALGDASRAGRGALLGDLLALAGAAFGGAYFVIGRRLRADLGLVAYITPVYGVAAAVLLVWATGLHQAFVAYPAKDWLIFAALAAGPMIVGHGGLNYALRYLPAYTVNVAALGEPVGATLIAWLLPAIAESPGLTAVAGGVLALGGIALALAATGRAPGQARSPASA
ncbi:MAG: DMT family transporter [Gemmatimonadales bacterium]